ncbi:hypothetical protein [Micromonospora foliorum]|uniref:hypothetical protein n=1 Tax=Micromonospora foliorum TaxID=2911210 RepID=UPI001EE8D64C|nr:hypothetical protein [Micromonospora foliorum]MCG5436663.1 hypothetical protein [Micromonospora foliorum]
MSSGSLDMDPEGLLHVALDIDTIAHHLRAVEPLVADENPPAPVVEWIDELPRITEELHQVADVIRTVVGSVSATDDEMASRLARRGDG